jgi:hypothetical protein
LRFLLSRKPGAVQLAEIANTRTVYHSLAAEASREAREDIAAALFRAGEVLARGGEVDRTGDVYMAEDQSFEDLRSLYAEKLARVQGMIAAFWTLTKRSKIASNVSICAS